MFVSVLVRRLRPGKTYEDFLEAWYPDRGFGLPVRGPILARNVEDDREIVALAFLDVEGPDQLAQGLTQVATQESVRHGRIEEVIESTSVHGIYQIGAEFDFSSDATVAQGRPPSPRADEHGQPDRSAGMARWPTHRRVQLLVAIAACVAVVGLTTAAASGLETRSSGIPVSGASAVVTMKDGLTAGGLSVKPFAIGLTIAGISFPNHDGADQALPGNVFVDISVRVRNLASAARLITFNADEFRTMAIGVSHSIPGDGATDPACVPPALDGLAINQQISNQVAAQWCVVAGSIGTVVVRAHKSKTVTFTGEVVSRGDARAQNFALIYSPSDEAAPTILPVGPGAVPTTVPS